MTELSTSDSNSPRPIESTDSPAGNVVGIGHGEIFNWGDEEGERKGRSSEDDVPINAPRNRFLAVAEALGWWFVRCSCI